MTPTPYSHEQRDDQVLSPRETVRYRDSHSLNGHNFDVLAKLEHDQRHASGDRKWSKRRSLLKKTKSKLEKDQGKVIKKITKTYQRQWSGKELAFDVNHDKKKSIAQQEASYRPTRPFVQPSGEHDPNRNDH